MIRKTLAGAVVVAAAAALFVSTAAADKPVTVPSPFSDATGRYCADFDVLVHATTNRGRTHIFSCECASVPSGALVRVVPVLFACDSIFE